MKITVNGLIFETPFTISGEGIDLHWLGKRLQYDAHDPPQERTDGEAFLFIRTDEDYEQSARKAEIRREERIMKEAAEIQARRDASGFTP